MNRLPRRPLAPFILLLAGLVLAPLVLAQNGKPPVKSRTAPPPKWTESTLRWFFADVTKEVGPGQPGSRPVATSVATTASSAATDGPMAGDGHGWSKLIDADTLEAEIKTNINALTTAVENSNKFKAQHFRKARACYSQLAVLFGVVAGYDGDVRWKDKAAGLRDVLAKAGFNCKVGTDASFVEAKARYEDLRQLLNGGTVTLPEGEPDSEWAKVADLTELMKRMEEAEQNRITPWTSAEGDFKANQEKVLHEAQLVAVMSQVIKHPSYDYGDDETYLGYASALQQACLEIVDGARQSNFDKTRTGAGNMAKACNNCHGDFR